MTLTGIFHISLGYIQAMRLRPMILQSRMLPSSITEQVRQLIDCRRPLNYYKDVYSKQQVINATTTSLIHRGNGTGSSTFAL